MWTSVGGKETLTSSEGLPDKAYPSQLSLTEPEKISLEFESGQLVGGIDRIRELNEKASAFAIGRGIHVGETIIGIKGRVGFEASAPADLAVLVYADDFIHTAPNTYPDQALQGLGSDRMVGLNMSEVLRGLEVVILSSDGPSGLNPLDLDRTLKLFDVRKGGAK